MQKHNTFKILTLRVIKVYNNVEKEIYMAKEEIPRGQLSNIILSTLFDNDKYGYEIIEVVKQQTDGKVVIKQPTLYSSLRRMEEQGLITSYWRDSEIGGRRHYYSITDYGKKYAEKWHSDLNDFLLSLKNMPTISQTIPTSQTTVLEQGNLVDLATKKQEKKEEVIQKPNQDKTFVQYDLFTSPTLISEPSNELFDSIKKLRAEADDEYSKSNDNKNDKIEILSSLRNSNSPVQEDITTNYVAKSYSVNHSPDVKKAFFDLTKNNKSFASALRNNEIEAKDDEEIETREHTDEDIHTIDLHTPVDKNDANLTIDTSPIIDLPKETLTKTNNEDKSTSASYQETIYQTTKFDSDDVSFVDLNQLNNESQNVKNSQLSDVSLKTEPVPQHTINETNTTTIGIAHDEVKKDDEKKNADDAVYITSTPEEINIPKVKRITSERFEKITRNYTSFLDEKLRKEKEEKEAIQNQTYEEQHLQEEVEQPIDEQVPEDEYIYTRQQQINNLQDLGRYYKENNLKFTVYSDNKNTNMKRYVRINWLNCLSFSILTCLAMLVSLVMFLILKNAQTTWNFLYILIPLLFICVDVFYIYKYYKSKSTLTLTSNVLNYNWIYQLTLCIVTILVLCSINVLAGLNIENVYSYLTTLLYLSVISVLYPLWSLINYVIIKVVNYKNSK